MARLFRDFEDDKIDLTLIKKAVEIKSAIVSYDPSEKGIRKSLNFGHTVGHALEAFYLDKDNALLHGEAIAIGMAVETLIASEKRLLSEEDAMIVFSKLQTIFDLRTISTEIFADLISLMRHDKKNQNGIIKMALIDDIGSCKIDVGVMEDEMEVGMARYNKLITT